MHLDLGLDLQEIKETGVKESEREGTQQPRSEKGKKDTHLSGRAKGEGRRSGKDRT